MTHNIKRLLSVLLGLAIISLPSTQAFAASKPAADARPKVTTVDPNGYDVSYPNCNATAPVSPAFGVVGVADGIVYSANPCLAAQAAWFGSNLSLYANTGLNASQSSQYYVAAEQGCNGDVYCAAYNYGVNAAQNALSVAQSANVSASTWWLDVENGNSWNSDTNQNRQELQGMYDALHAAGIATVGVYSTTAQWDSITGTWLNQWPNWGATTVRKASLAATFCTGHQFTGGQTLLIQYLPGGLDRDYAC